MSSRTAESGEEEFLTGTRNGHRNIRLEAAKETSLDVVMVECGYLKNGTSVVGQEVGTS